MTPQRTLRIYCAADGGFVVTTQRTDAMDEPTQRTRFGPVEDVDDALRYARTWLLAQAKPMRKRRGAA